jgi:hypothetical protein
VISIIDIRDSQPFDSNFGTLRDASVSRASHLSIKSIQVRSREVATRMIAPAFPRHFATVFRSGVPVERYRCVRRGIVGAAALESARSRHSFNVSRVLLPKELALPRGDFVSTNCVVVDRRVFVL